MGRDAGGLVVPFAGVVLIILAVKGTLGDTWRALTGSGASTPAAKAKTTGSVATTDASGTATLEAFRPPVGVSGSGVAPDAVPVPGSFQ